MDYLFWSGGKDAYLALVRWQEEHPDREVTLLTTFDAESEIVPHQRIPIDTIRHQAEYLNLPLITVPLPEECPNEKYLDAVEKVLKEQDHEAGYLVFGDWLLQDIREWREEQFGARGYRCAFPIWKESLHDLLPVLMLKPVEVKISAVSPEYRDLLKPGETYDQRLVRQLPGEIDPMGENGEFHTEVIFLDPKSGDPRTGRSGGYEY